MLFTKYVFLFYIVHRIGSDPSKLEHLAWAHVVGCFMLGWIAYRTNVSGRLELGGPGIEDANVLGTHLTTGLAFAGFMFLGLEGRRRWLAFAAIPFILNGVILTASRGAFLGLVAATVAGLYLCPSSRRRLGYVAVALGLVLFLVLAHDLFWERIGDQS